MWRVPPVLPAAALLPPPRRLVRTAMAPVSATDRVTECGMATSRSCCIAPVQARCDGNRSRGQMLFVTESARPLAGPKIARVKFSVSNPPAADSYWNGLGIDR